MRIHFDGPHASLSSASRSANRSISLFVVVINEIKCKAGLQTQFPSNESYKHTHTHTYRYPANKTPVLTLSVYACANIRNSSTVNNGELTYIPSFPLY